MCHKPEDDGFRNSISFLKNVLVVLSRNCLANWRSLTLINKNVHAKGINVTFDLMIKDIYKCPNSIL